MSPSPLVDDTLDYDTLQHPLTGDRPINCIARMAKALESNPLAQSQLVASILFTFWQLSERQFTANPPWFLTINASGPQDPLDEIIGPCFGRGKDLGYKQEPFSIEEQHAVIKKVNAIQDPFKKLHSLMPWQNKLIHDACREGNNEIRGSFSGRGRYHRLYFRRPKGDSWLVDTWQGCPKARIDGSEDVKELKRHLLTNPDFIRLRPNFNNNRLRISGMISPEGWDRPLVDAATRHAPFLYLPFDMPDQPISQADIDRFSGYASCFEKQCLTDLMPRPKICPVQPDLFLGKSQWIQDLQARIWSRLNEIESYPYRAFIMQTLHEIPGVCRRLAARLCAPETSVEEVMEYTRDFRWCAMRALLISVESLAYHGLGFNPVVGRKEMWRILDFIRAEGLVTKRDLSRRYPKLKINREPLLAMLESQSLIHTDQKRVYTVSFAEFVETLGNDNRSPGRHLNLLRLAEPQKAAPVHAKAKAS